MWLTSVSSHRARSHVQNFEENMELLEGLKLWPAQSATAKLTRREPWRGGLGIIPQKILKNRRSLSRI